MVTTDDIQEQEHVTKYKMLRVSEALHKRIKLMAVEKGKTIGEIVEELVIMAVEADKSTADK